MSNVTMSLEQYAALISLARAGASGPGDGDKMRALEVFLKDIDAANNVARYALLVQWQELDSPVPPGARFPDKWPPEMRFLLERTDRPIAKADVLAALKKVAKNPHEVMVTRDVGGVVGWTKIDDFFIT